MSAESGGPSPDEINFHVERSQDDDEDETPEIFAPKEEKKDFSLLESIARHSGESDDEEEPADIVSLFQTEPNEEEASESREQEDDGEPAVDELVYEDLETAEADLNTEEEPTEPTVPAAEVETDQPDLNVEDEDDQEASEQDEVVESEPVEESTEAEDPVRETPETEADEPDHEEEPEEAPAAPSVPTMPAPPEAEPLVEEAEEEDVPPEPTTPAAPTPTVAASPSAPSVEAPEVISVPAGTNKAGNALSVVAVAGAGLAWLRAGKARREGEREAKARVEADKKLAEAQAVQQAEFNQKLAEVRGAQEAIERNRIEQVARLQREAEQVPDKIAGHAQVEKTPQQTEAKSSDQTEVNREKARTELSLDSVENNATKTESIPSIGDILAEKHAMPASPEGQAPVIAETVKTPEAPEVLNATYLDPQEVLKPKEFGKSAEILLQQTEAAAEQDVAQEGHYELRHEVKDIASGVSGGLPTWGVSITKDDLFAKDDPLGEFKTIHLSDEHKELTDSHTKGLNGLSSEHKQAMWAGFWGAGIILVALAIWALAG